MTGGQVKRLWLGICVAKRGVNDRVWISEAFAEGKTNDQGIPALSDKS